MGLFLQTAIFPGSNLSVARRAVEAAAREPGDYELDPERCRYHESGRGTQVLLGDEGFGLAGLAQALSRAGQCPVLLLNIYDGDMWGYDLYSGGAEVDHFNPIPDYFGPVSEETRWQAAGNPEALLDCFGVSPMAIQHYLTPWTPELLGGEEQYAYPGDEFPYGDCWQLTDFTAKLGFPWPFDEEDKAAEPASARITLGDILERGLPPQPVPPGGWSGVIPMLGDLPSALDPDYIRRLLEEEELSTFRDKTVQETFVAWLDRGRIVSRPERDALRQKMSILIAFGKWWEGDPSGAFYGLYSATYEPIYGPPRGGTTDVELLRARGMAVPLMVKRHIAIKDLTRLLELDRENRDVYLLCRAYIYTLDCGVLQPRGVRAAEADLDELAGLGGLDRDDPRLNFKTFGPVFLERSGVVLA